MVAQDQASEGVLDLANHFLARQGTLAFHGVAWLVEFDLALEQLLTDIWQEEYRLQQRVEIARVAYVLETDGQHAVLLAAAFGDGQRLVAERVADGEKHILFLRGLLLFLFLGFLFLLCLRYLWGWLDDLAIQELVDDGLLHEIGLEAGGPNLVPGEGKLHFEDSEEHLVGLLLSNLGPLLGGCHLKLNYRR